MKLTTQMQAEVNFIDARLGPLFNEAFSNYPESYNQIRNLHQEELKTYKVRLENLFLETDIKEQSNNSRYEKSKFLMHSYELHSMYQLSCALIFKK